MTAPDGPDEETRARNREAYSIMDNWIRRSFYAMRDELNYRAHTPDGPLPGHITAAHKAANLAGIRGINKRAASRLETDSE